MDTGPRAPPRPSRQGPGGAKKAKKEEVQKKKGAGGVSTKARLRRDLDRLGEEDLRELLIDAMEEQGDAMVAFLSGKLYKQPADNRRCTICHKKYDANINSSRYLCRKEHDWDEPSDMGMGEWDDCCDYYTYCRCCHARSCDHGVTGLAEHGTEDLCWEGPHVDDDEFGSSSDDEG